ncbi:hypothetical protein [Pseudactinotalea sp. Z1748]|uniref:hypothetical protein n=1 Tax=Pseudactinotalea sp. Z1748 TaxID=3413027 RepID=UPI003C79B297
MSTVPGEQSWQDAGLVDPDAHEPVSLADETSAPSPESGEDYRPRTARPDLEGRASEADVADTAAAVPAQDLDDDDDG